MTPENKTISESKSNNPVPNFYRASAADLKKIPGSPIAYWTSDRLCNIFYSWARLGNLTECAAGISSGDNDKYLKLWFEVNYDEIAKNISSCENFEERKCKYATCNKGGVHQKWYGNNEYVTLWSKADEFHRNGATYRHLLFKEGMTWSAITSGAFSSRYYPAGSIFDHASPSLFAKSQDLLKYYIGLSNSKICSTILRIINPTINTGADSLRKVPVDNTYSGLSTIIDNVSKLIVIAKTDWDSYETSWDFTTLPLLSPEYKSPTIKESYTKLRTHWQEMTDEMQSLEEENNRIFSGAYGLEDELTPDVPLSEITLTCNPHYRYNKNKTEEELETLLLTDTMKEFISYAVGCMFGRYSLDKPGLILANQGDHVKDYLEQVPNPSFMPDDDNIIPILDDEYFTDDIVSRFKDFLKVTFGKETLSANLDFIAKALSDRSTGPPEQVIRNYFIRDFYKDHLQTYKKRPIYWMFSSGKDQGFNALIYMHRYEKSTLAKMRTDYLLELESKLDAEIGMLSKDIVKNKARITKVKSQIEEIRKYDELLNNKALSMIGIDLDDGVVVNYAKFEDLVKGI